MVARSHRRDTLVGVLSGVVAIAALVVGSDVQKFHSSTSHARVIEWLCVAGLVIAGVVPVRHIAAALCRTNTRRCGKNTGAGVSHHIRVRSGTIGVLDARVIGIGLTYVTVRTEDGVLKIPNSVMLASGIGHLVSPDEAEPLHPNPSTK